MVKTLGGVRPMQESAPCMTPENKKGAGRIDLSKRAATNLFFASIAGCIPSFIFLLYIL